MRTTLNLITNKIVYILSNLRSRRFLGEGRVIFESLESNAKNRLPVSIYFRLPVDWKT